MKKSKLEFSVRAKAQSRLLKMHFDSGVGHIGGNLSVLDSLLIIFHEYLGNQDQLILSKGHAAGGLYTALWSVGRLQDEDLKSFHKEDTMLPGHPPSKGIDDVIFATGSLGHGLSLAAGTALGFKLRNTDSQTFCIMSDGEWQEGSTWEALIFACHHQLSNLKILIDHNELQGFGTTGKTASMAPIWEKIQNFDIDLEVIDGHDLEDIRKALNKVSQRVKVIVLKTIKGHGVSFMQNKMEWHYLPLTADQFKVAIQDIEKNI
jgi:transketolase